MARWFTYPVLPPPSGELSEDVEAASETTTDQEDQTKDRESGGEKELTKGTGKAHIYTHLGTTTHMIHVAMQLNIAKQHAFCQIKLNIF